MAINLDLPAGPSFTEMDVVTASGTHYVFTAYGNRKNKVFLESTSPMLVQTHESGRETELQGQTWVVLGARVHDDGRMSFTIVSYPDGWAIAYNNPPNPRHSTFTTSPVRNPEAVHAFFKSLV